MLDLKPAERHALLAVINDGFDDTNFNYVKEDEFSTRLAEEWMDDSLRDYLT